MSTIKYQLGKAIQPTLAPLTAAVGLALSASTLQAATITVNDLTDAVGGSTCTLRNAIYSANLETAQGGCIAGTAGGNTIEFAAGLSGIIQLDAAATDLHDDASLRIGSELTISGPGPDLLTIRGDNASPVIYAKYNAESVVISGVTITNGNAPRGGGIFSRAESLNIVNSHVTGNTADLTGGGVWHGGTELYSNFLAKYSQFDDNLAIGTSAADGGGGVAIDFGNNGGSAVIFSSIFEGNIASGPGGGLMIRSADYSNADIIDSVFDNNTSKYNGGGAYLDLGYATLGLDENVFSYNQATDGLGPGYGGGAVIVERNELFDRAQISLTGNDFNRNSADGDAGGLLVSIVSASFPDLKSFDSTSNYFIYNTADGNGGGAVIMGGNRVDFSLQYNAAAYNTSGGSGGGMQMIATESAINIDYMFNIANQAYVAGGGLYLSASNSTIVASELRNKYNQAFVAGGALLAVGNSTMSLDRPVAYVNYAGLYAGGLMITGNQADTAISDGVIRGNGADYGGGLLVGGNDSSLSMKYSEISDNTALIGGGAWLPMTGSSILVANSTVSGNSAAYEGGGLYLGPSGITEADIRYSTIAYNQTETANGGGIFSAGADVTLRNSILSGNAAATGGASVDGAGTFTVGFSLIDDPATDATKYDDGGNIFKYSADLAPLDENDGFTRSHAIDSNSRAFNAGAETVFFPYDQRRQPRVAFGRVDMGAFETQVLADLLFRDRFQQQP